MPNLSIVIPFLNEKDNLAKTLYSIDSTKSEDVEIILVDDCSDDRFDYSTVAENYNCKLYRNPYRKGVAKCRDIGVNSAKSDNILLLDAHMKFFDKDWVGKISEHLKFKKTRLYCAKSIVLDESWNISGDILGAGATIDFYNPKNFFEPDWLNEKLVEGEISCVLGAAYFFDRDYYLHIGGLSGLSQWGCDEQYLSIKYFMSGGEIRLASDISVGHVYRSRSPYTIMNGVSSFNKLLSLYCLSTEKEFEILEPIIRKGIKCYDLQMNNIRRNIDLIGKIRSYNKAALRENSLFDFIEFNSTIRLNTSHKRPC